MVSADMSRSRRHTPILGITLAASEKDDKQRAAMRARKKVHDRLKPRLAGDEDFEIENVVEHPRSGQWTFAKDGKRYWAKATARDMRK
jgi:hypothetical protein